MVKETSYFYPLLDLGTGRLQTMLLISLASMELAGFSFTIRQGRSSASTALIQPLPSTSSIPMGPSQPRLQVNNPPVLWQALYRQQAEPNNCKQL
jgi:hypothetical protein